MVDGGFIGLFLIPAGMLVRRDTGYVLAAVRAFGLALATTALVNATGVPSTLFEAKMTTEASVEQVIQQYRVLLTRNPTHDEKVDLQPDKGRSVLFHDESEGRLFELLLILVNSETTSTTLIVSRGADEEQTQIK